MILGCPCIQGCSEHHQQVFQLLSLHLAILKTIGSSTAIFFTQNIPLRSGTFPTPSPSHLPRTFNKKTGAGPAS
jgi:hypothetical protein